MSGVPVNPKCLQKIFIRNKGGIFWSWKGERQGETKSGLRMIIGSMKNQL